MTDARRRALLPSCLLLAFLAACASPPQAIGQGLSQPSPAALSGAAASPSAQSPAAALPEPPDVSAAAVGASQSAPSASRETSASPKAVLGAPVATLAEAAAILPASTLEPAQAGPVAQTAPAAQLPPQAPSGPAATATLPQAAALPELPELFPPRRTALPLSLIVLVLPDPAPPALPRLVDSPTRGSALPAEASSGAAPVGGAGSAAASPLDPAPSLPLPPTRPVSAGPTAVEAAVLPQASALQGAPQAGAQTAANSAKAVPKPSASPARPSVQPVLPPTAASTIPIVTAAPERQPDIVRHLASELGSRVELPFDGTGWTYLGEKDGKKGVLYESRRYEGSGLVFVLNSNLSGDFVLRFQRQDLLRGTTNEELVGLVVTPKTPTSPPVAVAKPLAAAPSSAPAVGPAPALVAAPSQATSQTAFQPSPTAPPSPSSGAAIQPSTPASAAASSSASAAASSSAAAAAPSAVAGVAAAPAAPAAASLPDSPEALLLYAKNELAAGRVASCLAALDRFLQLWPAGMDEVFYTYGLALEQNGALKDIKRSYSFYRKLRDEYPQSEFWDRAQSRVSYIERHYFDIR